MARYAIILVLVIGGIAITLFVLQGLLKFVLEVLAAIVSAITHRFHAVLKWWRGRSALAQQRAQQLRLQSEFRRKEAEGIAREKAHQAESEELESYRTRHPVRVVGGAEMPVARELMRLMDGFISSANSFRPTFERNVDTKYRIATYTPISSMRMLGDEATIPVSWEMTPNDLAILRAPTIVDVYRKIGTTNFPIAAPKLVFQVSGAPTKPIVEIPEWSVDIVWADDGAPIDLSSDLLQRVYAPQISEASAIRKKVEGVKAELRTKAQGMNEAADLMDIYLAYEVLKFKEFKDGVLREYEQCKRRYESEAQSDLRFAEAKELYESRTSAGVEKHFHLALEMLSLPLPVGYLWAVYYDPTERILQVNQRVPLPSDIIVKRSDSKRPIAKRDADQFLRRILPAIVLHIAQHVARNDLMNDVDMIAVNGWARYFEKTTGKSKDAFVATLKASPSKILEIDINNADAQVAFRGLGGLFAYSQEEIVPVDPQIRLDKEDKRFVEGREVLSGLAQGQNLAIMDWQDFEHLIRELLSKEYARDGAEVKITRASRDQGVDAVIFDPDPLRGGKYVVQAKRYNGVVELSAVRDLWGTVMSEGASRGILVTTSWFGRDAYEWIANKQITLIDGPNLLHLLSRHGYRFMIDSI